MSEAAPTFSSNKCDYWLDSMRKKLLENAIMAACALQGPWYIRWNMHFNSKQPKRSKVVSQMRCASWPVTGAGNTGGNLTCPDTITGVRATLY